MFLSINGHDMHVTQAGAENAPAIVLLHALGTDCGLWDKQVAALSAKCRVICPDFRGHGLSQHSRDALSCDALASDILEMADELGLDRFAIGGCSLGGVVAQLVAAQLGMRATGMAVFSSYIRSLDPGMWRTRARAVREHGLGSIAPSVFEVWLPEKDRDTADGRGLRRMMERMTDEGYAAGCDALADVSCEASAPKIVCDSVVAYSNLDKAAPQSAAETLTSAIAGSELLQINGAGHIPMLHEHAVCTKVLRSIVC